MAYGDIRNYRKINVFVAGVGCKVTTWSRTCREAVAREFQEGGIHISAVSARFAETKEEARRNGRRA